jgi:hypothetical protein
MSDEDRVWFFKLGDRLWHSDSSFRPIPAKYSLLSARVLPSWGANTEFADMRAAYDALDARTKDEVEQLICESREAIGFADLTPEEIAAFRPVRQRLVRTHPMTGRKSLFLASHAGAIVGWTESARLFRWQHRRLAPRQRRNDVLPRRGAGCAVLGWRPTRLARGFRTLRHRDRMLSDRHVSAHSS